MELCAIGWNSSSDNFNQPKIMSSILEEIETKIEGLKTSTTKSNVGVVRETGDGVARIEGLSGVMLNEMIEFPNMGKAQSRLTRFILLRKLRRASSSAAA